MKVSKVEKTMGKKAVEELLKDDKVSKSEKVRQLFTSGHDVKEISAMLGIRYNFAYNVLQNYVLMNDIQVEKTERQSRKDDIIVLLKAGKSLADISRATKVNYNYIWKIAKEEGFTGKSKKVDPEVQVVKIETVEVVK